MDIKVFIGLEGSSCKAKFKWCGPMAYKEGFE
jgi:hypothetical protein